MKHHFEITRQVRFWVNHNYTDKELIDKLDYHFITKKSINILGEEYVVVGAEFDINTKDNVYILELKSEYKK